MSEGKVGQTNLVSPLESNPVTSSSLTRLLLLPNASSSDESSSVW